MVGVAPRVWSTANSHEELPVELPEFEALAQRTYIYDANGDEIGIYELENSQPIPFEEIPPDVVDAFLTVEDKEFFTHDGINVRSLIRATLSNFASEAPQQGVRRISMQVVKNDFLAGLERDGRYKLLQIHYARMLEKELSKEEILARYLNTVFFGNNAYGIAAAAETYFGKTAQELTFTEAAFLAGLVRSPSGFDPINEPERSRARWLQVVERLEDEGKVTPVEADQLAEFVLPFSTSRRCRTARMSAPTTPRRSATTCSIAARCSATPTRSATTSCSAVACGSTRRSTPTCRRWPCRPATGCPTRSRASTHRSCRSTPPRAGDPRDGRRTRVRAQRREVNMAISPRQTGSSIKLFILAAAVQAGAQQYDLIDGSDPCRFAVPGDDDFVVHAVNGGLATLQAQTTKSINCAFVRLSQIVGLNRVVDTTYRMARSPYLYKDQPASRFPIDPFISFATGANELAPIDMASGVQSIANEGVHHEPYYVEYIENATGERIYTHLDPGTEVLNTMLRSRSCRS